MVAFHPCYRPRLRARRFIRIDIKLHLAGKYKGVTTNVRNTIGNKLTGRFKG